MRKKIENQKLFDKPSVNILISKCNFLHAKIIEMIVDEVDIMYKNYKDFIKSGNKELAIKNKFMAIELITNFIDDLTFNLSINKDSYLNYIKILTQSYKIFN